MSCKTLIDILILLMIPQTILTTWPVSEKDLGKTLTAKNSFVFSYELIIKN
ncbi:hypothetical protein BgiMline_026389, partial [Biomphalaria glabrata]